MGWKQNDIRDYGCLLHLDIKNGKIWIQYDVRKMVSPMSY
ncbi:element excision factor XisI family protein [Nostoc sp.]